MMYNMNLFTAEEKALVNRFRVEDENDLISILQGMLPCLAPSELDAALSVIAKLGALKKEQAAARKAARKSTAKRRIRFLERITSARAFLNNAGSCQMKYFPV